MEFGSEHAHVELIKLALKRAGFFDGEINSSFGEGLQNSIIRFQINSGLTPNGYVDETLWNALSPYLTGYKSITISPGDTFWNIAERNKIEYSAIQRANPDIDALNLKIGDKLILPLGFDIVPTNVNYSYLLVKYIVDGLKTRYPFIETGSIGKSIMGNDLFYIKIGTGQKELFYNASHHANEWITTPLILKFIEDYLIAFSSNGKIFDLDASELYNRASLYVVPLVNPDGVDLVTGAIDEESYYYAEALKISQNYPQIPFTSGWKANIAGVDLNLNYPAEWERAKETKYALGFTSPAPRDFVGVSALSEPESRAMYDFTLSRDFLLTISYHTQGGVIYWKFMDYNPPMSFEIGQEFSRLSGYPLEITPEESGYAGYKDWYIQNYNRPGYTIEVGMGENPLPISDFDKIYSDNIGIMASAINMI